MAPAQNPGRVRYWPGWPTGTRRCLMEADGAGVGPDHARPRPRRGADKNAGIAEIHREQLLAVGGGGVDEGVGDQTGARTPGLGALDTPTAAVRPGLEAVRRAGGPHPPPLTGSDAAGRPARP